MRIVTPTIIEHAAWEGTLEAVPGVAFKEAGLQARVTLGEPACWSADQALTGEIGKTWAPPLGGKTYTLVRVACTLHPLDEPRARYREAILTAYLRPKQGSGTVIAHDLFPQQLSVESKNKLIFKLGPDLKFATLGEVGAEIEYPKVFPVIQGFGLGESRAYWLFKHHGADPLIGCQSVYLVLAAPPDVAGVRLSVDLVATLETRFGPLRAGLPETARAHTSYIIATPSEGDTHA